MHGSLAEHDGQHDVVCLERVSFRYGPGDGEGVTDALRDVTLHVERGCNLGIIGPNGAGKTTLIKIILGQLEEYTGSVSVQGMSPRQACRKGDVVGYVPQRHMAQWRVPVSVEQVVMMGLVGKAGLFRRVGRSDRDYAREVMGQVGIADLSDRPVGGLSGGQQQRVMIARALAPSPSVLILDEPMVGVDQGGQRRFADLIHELHERLGLTVILVSHDLRAVAAGCNRVACLNQTIHYHDAPGGLTREVLTEVFAHEAASVL